MNQEKLFHLLAEDAMEVIIVFEEKGKIVYANKTARVQLEYGEEIYDFNIADILPNTFQKGEQRFETDYLFGEEIQSDMAYRKNHTCFSFNMKIQKCCDDPVIYYCMGHDTSQSVFLEKKANQADQEIETAQKMKSEFVANITHELRTPVNGILGNTRELLERETDAENQKYLQMIERGCNYMNTMINSILDFSKLEAGKFTLEPRKFHFRNMMDYVKGNHINKITEKGLELIITISPEIPEYIIGDELRIVQILNNLLSNACKFTSVGRIAVEVLRTAQSKNRMELFFLIIDSGIGIAKNDQDKLFKSFSQVDASISRKYGGTGLGLNICKQLVELMGGNIQVESEVGKGTIFSFHIWVETQQSEEECQAEDDKVVYTIQNLPELGGNENIWKFGEKENLEELQKKMSKLILSVEMENWEKAEMFVETVKQLTEDAPREVKSATLRLKMAVQKGDYEKTSQAFETLQTLLS